MYHDPDKIERVDELPVKERRRTDFFCAIFFAIYVVLLAVVLAFLYNQST
jgi:predicted nucleic acid-binding Zn ribbon protein